ncbi:hypothetical protein [Arthrobacter sp. NPDC057013]|uniref:hypothetical protein n=1 Tax=Arthrobacter sp. NPDC057013 TaxID=3345999 RepID=UPI003630B4A0
MPATCDGAIEGNCTTAVKPPPPPGVVYKKDFSLALPFAIQGDFTDNDIAYNKLLRIYADELVSYGGEYDVDVTGLLGALPNPFRYSGSSGESGHSGGSSSGYSGGSYGGGGSGYTVVCSDGWVSHSGGRQGACSHHGGIG